MTKYLIVLPDGTEITSGTGESNAIASVQLTELTNSETELALGSVCASVLEATIITPGASLNIVAGSEITLYNVDESTNARSKAGLFTAEKPTRPSANRYKITAYDRVTWLDKDLTDWATSLTDWPYRLDTLSHMVCELCGLTLATETFPNGSFMVYKPSFSDGVTGRQLMKWIAEIAGRFCVANEDGELEFRWYEPSGVTVSTEGDNYYFSGSLSYEDYKIARVDAVKIRMADSDSGVLWPAGDADNPYIIKGNRLLNTNVTSTAVSVLETIFETVCSVQYTPCKVSVPISVGIRAGQIFDIVDGNGNHITTFAMSVIKSGQKITIESTGSAKRNSSESMNFMTNQDIKDYADSAASGAVAAQTQDDIFNKLTNNGKMQGIYMIGGELYFNASYIASGFISADIIRAGHIRSTDFQLSKHEVYYPADDLFPSDALFSSNGEQIVRGFEIDFEHGVIRGVFWSEITDALTERIIQLENRLQKIEDALVDSGSIS